VPTGPAADLPDAIHEPYEDAIRRAGREVGQLFLQAGDLPRAWSYYRMLGEPEPVRQALETFTPGPEEDVQPVIELAFQQGVHPSRGFDLLLERYGICTAITMTGSYEFPHGPDVRQDCIRKLVRALDEQLRERLRAEVAQIEGTPPPASATVAELIAGRDALFADDLYHVDVSHLASVVQMALQLPAGGDEVGIVRDLCRYGQRLSPQFQSPGDPPFEDLYRDGELYFAALAGERIDEAIAHFRAKADDPETADSNYPAEVYVNLLVKIGRPGDERMLSCPNLYELCQKANDYAALAAAARQREDPVHYLAGLIAAQR
jgi:hypothetical protein